MSKIERETVVDFEYKSKMRDVGHIRMKLKLLRRTANIATVIKSAKARMLGGRPAASPADDLHFDVMATLSNAVEPVPNPRPLDSAAWVDDLLDPGSWYAIYDRWNEYQESFSQPEPEHGASGKAAV